ncbi:ZIP family metal transporter [Parasporobacterium paucivorans]|uniref:Zinc transporter, ZIP family n=1 Tax=Parasporobacterium paucivorans DSM 15970 TaxID=1122934 RepID=A0A1M6GFT3_9FIRM|nr:ZIP family metal transporter [Parasporobacterium paucivorans]SHJ08824.1 zinc transporter, ZIP family [Parasporobacterium paucivorans DSM 15970]
MEEINSPVVLALIGTGITFLATVIGAATVFFVAAEAGGKVQKTFLGFASGVMIAASVWSLLLPAIEMSKEKGDIEWLPAALGFISGGIFLFLLDKFLPHLHADAERPEGIKSKMPRSTLLVLAVTLHNIPEGMAVGLAFAMASKSSAALTGAFVLATGMALQNLPEGAAISLPLRGEGFSKQKSFLFGAASGIVEPMAGLLGVLLAVAVVNIMPFMLSFAAGAMIYVVVDELVPEAYSKHSNIGTLGAMAGFVLMMVLDIAFT